VTALGKGLAQIVEEYLAATARARSAADQKNFHD
jgi:hypothetical protein